MTRNFPQNRNKLQQNFRRLLLTNNNPLLTINKLLQFVTKLVLFCLKIAAGSLDLRFENQEEAMRAWVGSSTISGLAGVITAAWLCGAGTAWAGDGGDDQGFFQQFLDTVCNNI